MKLERRVVSEAGYVLSNPTNEEMEDIRSALTFDNPKYAQAKRFSRWANTRIPQYLMYYRLFRENGVAKLRVPYGFMLFDFLHKPVKASLNKVREKVSFPNFLLTLRNDQKEAAKNYVRGNETDQRHAGIIVMPTGKGKSILGMYLAYRLSVRTLVIVHKNDLVAGWRKDARLCFGEDFELGHIQQDKREVKEITIAMVQTLSRMESSGEIEEYFDMFDLVIMDECHHAPSTTFSLVDKFRSRYRLGLTATLERKDGMAFLIPLYFGTVAYYYQQSEEERDILPVEVIVRDISFHYDPLFEFEEVPASYDSCGRVRTLPYLSCTLLERFPAKDRECGENECFLSDLGGEKKKMVDFSYADIDTDSVMCEEVRQKVIDDLKKEFGKGHSCVLFFTQKEHLRSYASAICEQLNLNESSIGLYYGDSSNEENERVLSESEKRNILITLTTYKKAGEGTNCKAWEVGFLVSSVADGKVVEQAVGRIRRVAAGKMKAARLYDYNYGEVQGLKNQYMNRKKRYKKLSFDIKENVSRRPTFSIGFGSIRK